MSVSKHASEESPLRRAGGAGGPPPPPPARGPRAAEDDDAYKRRLKLTDVIGFVALNGYAREVNACSGLCRETWRCIPAGLSSADADRVRRDHPLWQAIINLVHGRDGLSRLGLAARRADLARVRELCDWRADIEAGTPLMTAIDFGHLDVVRELLSHGANVNAVSSYGFTALSRSSYLGHVEVVRALLAAGVDKHIFAANGSTATSIATAANFSNPGSRAAILALLAAAP
jgi:hypothetical protein